MNLVNDLLLESERKRSASTRAGTSPLDDLVAVRERSAERRSRSRSQRVPGPAQRAVHSSALVSFAFGAAGFALAGVALGAGILASTGPLALRLERIAGSQPPAVAARPAPEPEPVESAAPAPIESTASAEANPTPASEEPRAAPDGEFVLAPDGVEVADVVDVVAVSDASVEPDPFGLERFDDDTSGEDFAGARVIVPSLGDPEALSIEPSRRDRERAEERALRAERDRLVRVARAARDGGRRAEAESAFEQALALDPDDESVRVELCEVVAALGRSREALENLEAARSRAPRSRPLLLGQAQLLAREGDLAAAIRLLDASELGPTEAPDVHALAAAYLQRSGDHERAIERYEQLLRRYPEESRAWLGLGISLEATGRPNEARDVYRIALSVGELPVSTRSWITSRLAASPQER